MYITETIIFILQRYSLAAPARTFRHFFLLVLFGTLTWAVWNQSYTWQTLTWGFVLSFISFGLTNKYLLKAPYEHIFRIHPLVFLQYLGVLFVAIFHSGIHAMALTLRGKIDIGVVDVPTEITNPFHGALVATAITLTPGTVTVNYQPGRYKIIWIESLETDPQKAGDIIKGQFERVLLKSRHSQTILETQDSPSKGGTR